MNKITQTGLLILGGILIGSAIGYRQVWAGSSQSFGALTMTTVKPRVITPNGDAKNDTVFFQFDSALSGLPIESSIVDISGAKVSGMSMNSDETALTWNGKDENGKAVPAGIYIYAIKIGKKLATGTVVVAK